MPYLKLSALTLLIASIIMTLVWWRQFYTRNAGIVDAWWAYNFAFIVILFALLAEGDPMKRVIIMVMVTVWSVRLGTHLLIRNKSQSDEDQRYKKLRQAYGQKQNFRMWLFFIYQAISNVFLSIPFLLVCLDNSASISSWSVAGMIVWTIGIIGESIADHQLKSFKQADSSQGKVCQIGFWKYSRHPNYFFEWLIWVGYALVALSSPYGWAALVCPLLIFVLLNKITGIPMLEELAVKSKGIAYVNYQKTTSAFFPWFKKKI